MQYIDAGQLAASFIFGFFGSIALIMLYDYCFVGDRLTQQVYLIIKTLIKIEAKRGY